MNSFAERQSIAFYDTVVFPIYFGIYFSITLFSQVSVVLLVFLKTPSFFRDFRIFLINSSMLQIIMCSMITFTQVRPVENENSTGYLFSGHCKLFHKNVCFFTLDLFQLVFDASSFAIPVTVYYKYIKVTSINVREPSFVRVKLILVSAYFLSVLVGAIYLLSYRPGESLAVESETKELHSDLYDFANYAQITGYQNHFWSSLTSYLNMLSIYVPSIFSLIFIRRIQLKLKSLKHLFSEKTAVQAKKFDLALTIQTFVPAICVIPAYTLHLVVDSSYALSLPSHEKVLYLLLTLPTAVDAFIVIFTITPYQKAFLSFFCCCNRSGPSSVIRVNSPKIISVC